MQILQKGALYIVATPIGNLNDISQRAIDTLAQVDWIAAEDTRHSVKLLQHLALNKPLLSLHEHNEQERLHTLQQKLAQGESGALISDAGTPLISDPGYHLVRHLRQQNIEVLPIPGACAVVTALSAAGLPTDRFTFEGFLPAKANKRQAVLKSLVDDPRTLVFYETPHRLLDCLGDFEQVCGGEREMVVAKELTKQFEQFVSGSISQVRDYFIQHQDRVRGEFVLMLAAAEDQDEPDQDWEGLVHILLKQSLPVKQISQVVAEFYGVKKNEVYQRVLAIKNTM